jgi:nitrite reductase/ring-hydroxylating ferredoxin subunit
MARVVVHYREVLLVHLPEGVFALSALCPHARGPLWKGTLTGTTLTCPWHSWTFDVRTGASPGGGAAATFPVRIDGDRILVDVGPPPATPPPPPISLPEDM